MGARVKHQLRIALVVSGLAGVLGGRSLEAQTQVIIVTGASREPQYATAFHAAGSSLVAALVPKHGLTPDHITYLSVDTPRHNAPIHRKLSKQVPSQHIP